MRRFVELRDCDDVLVLDLKRPENPVIVCRCEGWKAPLQAQYVAEALESYHGNLYETMLGREWEPTK